MGAPKRKKEQDSGKLMKKKNDADDTKNPDVRLNPHLTSVIAVDMTL